ncbi:MAG: hypothetical protein IIA87_02045 [Nanoarchaeota archaeon]|nr:hypothetical protein [Nanoarchaeota archaeon]
MKFKKGIAFFEIALLIGLSFSFSYFVSETNVYFPSENRESDSIKLMRKILLSWLSHGLVSAREGLWTCLEDVNGSFCQEYVAAECDERCTIGCLPTRREFTNDCKLGTCIDKKEGTCSPNSPKFVCEDKEGEWREEALSELSQCSSGCCLIGTGAQYVTERTCNVLTQRKGLPSEFKQVANELECLALANLQAEGACVLDEIPATGGKRNCKFTIKENCNSIGGEFHEKILCSNEELNTICEKQETITCAEGKDEVYWFDSCGNRENIYDANKVKSYNDGKILAKEDSCSLSLGNNPLSKQASCGNCAYLAGSICGSSRKQDEKIIDRNLGDFVCRDLSCISENGDERKHGESWCAYDGQIGVQGTGNEQRSVDVPGSRHYRIICLDGEIRTEPCADFRNEVCSESRDEKVGFSSASCRTNNWQRCYASNKDVESLEKCEEISDCVLKTVDLTSGGDDTFKFNLCVPKYPAGFDLRSEEGSIKAERDCSFASVKCKKVTIKRAFRSKKKINVRCDDQDFTETMNNLCMSLGDCGGQVNILGEYTDDGYKVFNAPELDSNYIIRLNSLTDVKKGQRVEPLTKRELASIYGIDTTDPDYDFDSSMLDIISGISGIAGLALVYAVQSGAVVSAYIAVNNVLFALGFVEQSLVPHIVSSYAGAAAGALIGAAVTSLLIKYSGIGGGLSDEIQITLIVAGATAGGVAGFSLAGGAFAAGSWFPVIGWIAAIGVVIFIGIGYLLGWGKKKNKIIIFECLPWQPPRGGSGCGECGKDGFPCSEYKCQSLGQTCQLINEGTIDEACVNINPEDVIPPVISPNEDVLLIDYEYISVTSDGFTVKGQTSDGCLPVYTNVRFGIELDEPGQCKLDIVHTNKYEDMENFFAGSNLYKKNHVMEVIIPNLDALQGDGIDPNKRADFNLFVRCSDKNGNENIREYAINFCVSPQDDLTAPIVSGFIPESGGFVALDDTEEEVTFFVNEPAECRWDSADVDYDLMTKEIECDQDAEEITLFGFHCSVNLPIEQEENNYYIRCKDQPWLEVDNPNNKERNKNSQSYIYTLKRSASELQIVSINPNNETILSGGLPVVIDLEVRTEGGAEGVLRYCEFDFAGNGNFVRFFESIGDNHRQPRLNLFFAKDYNIALRCLDDAGNVASGNAQFRIKVDNIGPLITRIYRQNDLLTVITNENSECSFDIESCGFNFENGTLMQGNELVHTVGFEPDLTHYVKCRDVHHNPSSCLVVRGGFF